MKSAVQRMSASTKNGVFGGFFVFCFLLAVCPPLYLWATRTGAGKVIGLPFSVAYMLFDAILLTVVVAALYWVEDLRGELD
jgi:hypothetical protein